MHDLNGNELSIGDEVDVIAPGIAKTRATVSKMAPPFVIVMWNDRNNVGYPAFFHEVVKVSPAKRDAGAIKIVTKTSSAPVNDYVCPSCRNDKCSKSEGKCWKCGNAL